MWYIINKMSPALWRGNAIGEKTVKLKKCIWLIIPIFLLCSCSKQETTDIQPEYEALVFNNASDAVMDLGKQIYQGKEILLTGTLNGSVYLCREEEAPVLLRKDVPEEYVNPETVWWLDKDGRCFVLRGDRVILLDEDGKPENSAQAEGNIVDICQSASGEIVLLISKKDNFTFGLSVLHVEDNKADTPVWLKNSVNGISKGHNKDILLVDETGICEYSLSDNKKEYYMKWKGTSYTPSGMTEDIRFISDNQIEIYTAEKMLVILKKINLQDSEKKILTYRTTVASQEEKELIVRFNQENPDYYIRIVECSENMDFETFREKTSMEIAAGYGPDIIKEYSVKDIYALLQKGALEELTPYIDQSGLDREAYFPAAFQGWGVTKGCYGIAVGMGMTTWCIDEELFAEDGKWDIDSMLDTLESCTKETAFAVQYDSSSLLCTWLSGAEDLLGMIDWETGTCDFSGERWKRLLMNADRYGYREDKKENGVIAYYTRLTNYLFFSAYDNGMKSGKKVPVGQPGEDNGITSLSLDTLGMNAASKNKEGVWQFFQFMLQEEVQEKLGEARLGKFPVHKQAFIDTGEKLCDTFEAFSLEQTADGWEVSTNGLTRDQLASIEGWLEKAEYLPWRTAPILEIIEEETQMYFNGVKSMEEVTDIIENRVQLYLDENT